MMLGYARVFDERTGYHRTGLRVEVCRMREDFLGEASGGRWDRPELHRLFRPTAEG
jgi:hypothetical protein